MNVDSKPHTPGLKLVILWKQRNKNAPDLCFLEMEKNLSHNSHLHQRAQLLEAMDPADYIPHLWPLTSLQQLLFI